MPGKKVATFCRVRPAIGKPLQYQVQKHYKPEVIEFEMLIPGTKVKSFGFNKVFDADANQEQVFESAGKPAIDNVLKGYNGTIFAYGQTASGKTYTMLGENLEDPKSERRGLIPRSLEYIFQYLGDKGGHYTMVISYLEIYNERGYDLLNGKSHRANKKWDLQEVTCRMVKKHMDLNNLSLHKVSSKKEAMDILRKGGKNRSLAKTYANDTSSRSHCIFTIQLNIKEEDGTMKSKLNFVDLAGSERISKDHLGSESLIGEAKNINKSLLFLHNVIDEISSGKKFVSFRNTMITRILRDSLIGNCMTSVIATISIEEYNRDETISTCHFATSVSKIQTKPTQNKVEDLQLVIARLQKQIFVLQKKLESKDSSEENILTNDDTPSLKQWVLEYYDDGDPNRVLQFYFDKLKRLGKL